jgi:hypothetical protein
MINLLPLVFEYGRGTNMQQPPSSRLPTLGKITIGCLGLIVIIAAIAAIFSYGDLRNRLIVFIEASGGILASVLLIACAFAPVIFWVWTLVDCIKNEPSTDNDKIIWVLIMIFTNFLGSFLYVIIRRPQRKAKYGV